jgi:hypothetical protein
VSGKKSSVDFKAGLRAIEERDAVRRHVPAPPPSTSVSTPVRELPVSLRPQQANRRGKVAITHWVDPAVRKQLARLALDLDSSQADLPAQALNLLFVPLSASIFVADHLRPAAKKAGVQIADGQRFGLHNLRHSFSNWLV